MYIRTGFDPMPWPRACCGIAGLGNGTTIPIREKEVKALIKAKDPEAFALLTPLRVPCPLRRGKCVFTEVKRAAAAGGADHVWTLAITGDVGMVGGTILVPGMTVVLKPDTSVSRGKTTVTHPILVFVNPIRATSGWPDKKLIPNEQKRLEYHFSETLCHELIHTALIIERELPPGTAHSGLFSEFQTHLKTANSPGLRAVRQAVIDNLVALMAFAGLSKSHPEADVDRQLEFLVNEKFASHRSAFAFGRPKTNAQTAKTYSREVAARLASAGTPAPDQKAWKLRLNSLIDAVSAWYDAIDAKRAAPSPTVPGRRFPPIIDLEPAILKLLRK